MRDEADYAEVEVEGVGSHPTDSYVVVLRDGDRRLPVVIAQCEAMAIMQRKQDDFEAPRPLTHDFAVALWQQLGASVIELRIDDLFQGIYYSKLVFEQNGRQVEVDCRPSDGIAMALTAGAPIYVAYSVFEETERRDDETEDEV